VLALGAGEGERECAAKLVQLPQQLHLHIGGHRCGGNLCTSSTKYLYLQRCTSHMDSSTVSKPQPLGRYAMPLTRVSGFRVFSRQGQAAKLCE